MRAAGLLFLALAALGEAALKEGDCEVCVASLNKIAEKVGADRKDLLKTEAAIGAFCEKPASDKETKLCVYATWRRSSS
jgi:hypothetical protein